MNKEGMMPGNTVSINNYAEFYVGDSRMPELIKFLKEKGFPENKGAKEILKEASK